MCSLAKGYMAASLTRAMKQVLASALLEAPAIRRESVQVNQLC